MEAALRRLPHGGCLKEAASRRLPQGDCVKESLLTNRFCSLVRSMWILITHGSSAACRGAAASEGFPLKGSLQLRAQRAFKECSCH